MCRPSVAGWASSVWKERAVTQEAHGDGLESSGWLDLPGVQWQAKEDLPEEKSWEYLGNTFHPMGEDHRKDTWERWEGKFWQSLRGRVCKNNENSVNNENNVFAVGIDNVSHWLHLFDFSPLHCVFSISWNGPIWKRKRIMCCLQQVLTGSRPSSAHISLWQSLSLLFNFYILTFPTHNIATTHIPKIFLGHCISTLFYLITNDLIHNAMTMKKKTSCYLTGPLGNLILKHLRSFVAN